MSAAHLDALGAASKHRPCVSLHVVERGVRVAQDGPVGLGAGEDRCSCVGVHEVSHSGVAVFSCGYPVLDKNEAPLAKCECSVQIDFIT